MNGVKYQLKNGMILKQIEEKPEKKLCRMRVIENAGSLNYPPKGSIVSLIRTAKIKWPTGALLGSQYDVTRRV